MSNNKNHKRPVGHSLQRACLQPAPNTQNLKPRPPAASAKTKPSIAVKCQVKACALNLDRSPGPSGQTSAGGKMPHCCSTTRTYCTRPAQPRGSSATHTYCASARPPQYNMCVLRRASAVQHVCTTSDLPSTTWYSQDITR